MGRSTIVAVGKAGFLLTIWGFFFPIILNQTGFELIKYVPEINKYISETNNYLSLIGIEKIKINLNLISICFYLIFIFSSISIILYILFKILKIYYDTYIDLIILFITTISTLIIYVEIRKILNIITDSNIINEYLKINNYIGSGIIQGGPYMIIIGISYSILFSVISIFEKNDDIDGLKEFRIINFIKGILKKQSKTLYQK